MALPRPVVRRVGEDRSIVHLNVADFAVAVERVIDRRLRERPVVVAPLGLPRAMVHDMSEEAFREGVRKGMPLVRARRLCPDVLVVPPRPGHYRRAMMEILRRAQPYSPLLEAEDTRGHLFLDLSGTERLWGPPQDVAWRLRKAIRADLGLEPIWTLGPNKLVAKTASRVVKPRGEYMVLPGEEEEFLAPLPLELLPGLESEDLLRLSEYNLRRVEDAARWSLEQLAVVFGRRAMHLHRVLHGRDDSPVLPPSRLPGAIRLEHRFEEDSNQRERVEAALYAMVERTGARLRRLGKVARRVAVEVEYGDGVRVIRQRSRSEGTADDFVLFRLARSALDLAWRRRVRLRGLRLVCDRLIYPPAQRELPFPGQDEREERRERLLAALDLIRERHGHDAIRPGRLLAN